VRQGEAQAQAQAQANATRAPGHTHVREEAHAQGNLEEAMDDDVGVASDRRREVGVVRHGEGVVTPVFRRQLARRKVLGQLHRLGALLAQKKGEERVGGGIHALHEPLQLHGRGASERQAHSLAQALQVGQRLVERLRVPPQEGLLRVGLGNDARYRLVGEEHELLDQLVGLALLVELNVYGQGVRPQDKAHLVLRY